ncbi:UvrD-helicase domain-containing protein, partial [Pantoea agglomerans]|uniref:UvrD-helicase domain-containing protein n=1 Tax=Enterobacter agglomerans TaxID=549 RepID=UPI003EEB7374
IIKRETASLGLKSIFSLFDVQDQLALLKELTKEWLEEDKTLLQQLISTISNWKNDLIDPLGAAALARSQLDNIYAHCYALYSQHLKSCNV